MHVERKERLCSSPENVHVGHSVGVLSASEKTEVHLTHELQKVMLQGTAGEILV